jgi:hypothetical protein
LELLKTVLKLDVVTVFGRDFFIGLYFFFPENFTELFGDHHEGFECFLNGLGNPLNERIVGEDVFGFGDVASLEHLLPNLV